MESTPSRPKSTNRIGKIIGIVLLVPPIISVLLCVWHLLFPGSTILRTDHLGIALLGGFYGGEPSPTAPIYLGLMAIAGAILLEKAEKK
jgi:hypothetical protein